MIVTLAVQVKVDVPDDIPSVISTVKLLSSPLLITLPTPYISSCGHECVTLYILVIGEMTTTQLRLNIS